MNLDTLRNTINQNFNSNPTLNAIYFLFGVIGIILSVFFYFKNKKNRAPTYVTRTVNLIREYINKIETVEILYARERIKNLSISKIALWNDGKETINHTDVAIKDSIKISITNNFQILDAQIIFQKNNANDFKIELSGDKKNINITFDYFDFEEGIIVQLYHTADSSSDIQVEGTIKSVKKITRKEIANSLLPSFIIKAVSFDSLKIKKKTIRLISGWILIVIGFISSIALLIVPHYTISEEPSFLTKLIGVLVGVPYMLIGYRGIKRRIPKGFDIFDEEF